MADEKLTPSEKLPPSPGNPSPALTGTTFAQETDLECGGQPDRQRSWLQRLHIQRQPTAEFNADEHVITRSLESCPNGYPKLAAFLSSEDNFMLYRSFSGLHSRVLLNLQDEIVSLERELDELDRYHDEHGNARTKRRLKSRSFDVHVASKATDEDRSRSVILAELQTKLIAYDDLMMRTRELNNFQRPSNRDYRSVSTWIWNKKPLLERDQEFILRKEDIVSLRHGREWAGFDGFIEAQLRKMDCSFVRWLFCTPELRAKTTDQHVFYYSAPRVEAFVGILITILIFILLILPVIAMYKLTAIGKSTSTFDAVGVLVVFTLLFSAAMSMLTKARRHELFAASAAYCAILVVFISNFNVPSAGNV